MNRYLVEVQLYFKGKETFEVLAESKESAILLASKKAEKIYSKNEYISSSIKIVKKLKL